MITPRETNAPASTGKSIYLRMKKSHALGLTEVCDWERSEKFKIENDWRRKREIVNQRGIAFKAVKR